MRAIEVPREQTLPDPISFFFWRTMRESIPAFSTLAADSLIDRRLGLTKIDPNGACAITTLPYGESDFLFGYRHSTVIRADFTGEDQVRADVVRRRVAFADDEALADKWLAGVDHNCARGLQDWVIRIPGAIAEVAMVASRVAENTSTG